RKRSRSDWLASLDTGGDRGVYGPLGSAHTCQHTVSHWVSLLLSVGGVPWILFSNALLHPCSAGSIAPCWPGNQQTHGDSGGSADSGWIRSTPVFFRRSERANPVGQKNLLQGFSESSLWIDLSRL